MPEVVWIINPVEIVGMVVGLMFLMAFIAWAFYNGRGGRGA